MKHIDILNRSRQRLPLAWRLARVMCLSGVLLCITWGAVAADDAVAQPPAKETAYTIRDVEGWNIHVSDEMLQGKPTLATDALALMQVKLFEVKRVVPKPALEKLRKVQIWLEDVKREEVPCATYHPGRQWLVEHHFNPDLEKAVHIASASNFLNWSHAQPWMMLHELAHAYHDQVLGFEQPELKAAYEHAVESKTYDSVLHYNGRSQRAYALDNPQEYFAELSEAYFGTNDFYPFVRAELQKHDPTAFDLLKKLWGDSSSANH